MKEIKALSKQIKDQEAEIKRIGDEVEKTDRAAEAASLLVERLSTLRQQRAQEVATAIVEKRAPNTTHIDAQIAESEVASERARIEADEARAMGGILRARLDDLRGELEFQQNKRRGVALGEMERLRGDAIDEYVEAVNALGPIVARVKAADLLIRAITPSAALPHVLPGELLFNRIHAERMPVPWSHSARREPERHESIFATPRASSPHAPVMDSPEWMRDDALVRAEVAAQGESFRVAGLEI